MNKKILFVDDDINVLNGYKRTYRKKYNLTTAISGQEGLRQLKQAKEDFAVIISDMKMPAMNGIEFLSKVKDLAPDSVRIILTGNADLTLAKNAVNDGKIFQILKKPCKQDRFVKVVEEAIELHRILKSKQTLSEKNLCENSSRFIKTDWHCQSPKIFPDNPVNADH